MPDENQIRSVLTGTAAPEELNTFLNESRSNPLMDLMDHKVRQDKFKESKDAMQSQLEAPIKAAEEIGESVRGYFDRVVKGEFAKEGAERIINAFGGSMTLEKVQKAISGEGKATGGGEERVSKVLEEVSPFPGGSAGLVGGELMSPAARKIPGVARVGPEGKVRFEISDAAASLTREVSDFIPQRVYRLDEVMQHDEAYKAYPKLREVPVIFKRDMRRGNCGAVSPSGAIHISMDPKCEGIITALHEVQHKVQDIEDFARGGSSSEFVALRMDEESAVQMYTNLYGEAEARAVSAKFRTLKPLYEQVQKTLTKRDTFKKDSFEWKIEQGRLGHRIADVERAEKFSVQDYINRESGDIPLIVKTKPLTSKEVDAYMERLIEWKASTPDPMEAHRALPKELQEFKPNLGIDDMARSTTNKSSSTMGAVAKRLEEATKAIKESTKKKPARLTVNRDAKGLISTIDIA